MDAALLALDRGSGRTVVAQLVDGLRRGILDGALRTGDAVPSTRALAADLGVARSSVVAAYEQLAGEGYLELRQGAATRVAAIDARHAASVSLEHRSGGDPAAAPEPARIDLSPGVPSTARLDERAWRAAWRTAAAAPPSTSPPPLGVAELRAAVAEHLRLARGVACSADDVVVTAGTSEALALTAMALGAVRGPGPRVGVEDPGYPSGRRALARHGTNLVPLPVAGDGLELGALEEARLGARLDAVMVTPSHQYPLGGRLPVAGRLELLDRARRTGAFIIEDDYDSEFRHTGAPLPALASLDDGERVVLVGSFSKVLTPWLRLGYLVLPRDPELRRAVAAARTELDSPVAGPVQLAMATLLGSGALRRHIAATRREYRHRRRLVLEALGGLDASAAGVRVTALDGGLHAVLELPDPAAERRLVARLRAEGIVVAPLEYYSASGAPARPAGIVLGYAGVSDLALTAALARIRELVHPQP